jgi:hypothetical protein
MPEVRFDDVQIALVEISKTVSYIPLDPKYLEVCEPYSFEAWASSRKPVAIGCCVEDGSVRLELNDEPIVPLRVAIRLTGIRKGFRGLRFPDRTQEEFEANERFIQSAYPGEETE